MFYTYIIRNKRNGTLYTGHTEDICQRMEYHKTKRFKGFAADKNCRILVWFEEHPTRNAAFKRERQIKAWRRRWKLELIEKENPRWFDITEMPVWPLPQGELLSHLRKAAYHGATGSQLSLG